jgi:hypothetical protein
MTQQHVLYGIKVAERDRDRDGLWRLVQDSSFQAALELKLTRGPFKITDHCANDLARG